MIESTDNNSNCWNFKQADITNEFTFGEILGYGSTSHVNECVCKKTGTPVAIKTIAKSQIEKFNSHGHHIQNEISILQTLSPHSHQNIIQLKDLYENPNYIFLVLELIRGDLFFEVVKRGPFSNEKVLYLLFRQIVDGLKFVHSHGIVHRDIKCDNILVLNPEDDPSNFKLKLADFGLSVMTDPNEGNLMNSRCGTPAYLAPEIVLGQCYTKAVDLWSLGVVLYLMKYCDYPFPVYDETISSQEYFRRIVTGIYKFPEDQAISSELKDLIKNLLCTNPEERITLDGVENHPWMKMHFVEEDAGKVQPPPSPLTRSISNVASPKPVTKTTKAGIPALA